MSQLAMSADRLKKLGVVTLAVVATEADRARLYYRYHPTHLRVAADPDLRTHRAYGLPNPPKTPRVMQIIEAAAAEMARELSIPILPGQASAAILGFDGFEPVVSDPQDAERDQALVIGQFLIDSLGIVRWVQIERTPGERLNEEQLVAAL